MKKLGTGKIILDSFRKFVYCIANFTFIIECSWGIGTNGRRKTYLIWPHKPTVIIYVHVKTRPVYWINSFSGNYIEFHWYSFAQYWNILIEIILLVFLIISSSYEFLNCSLIPEFDTVIFNQHVHLLVSIINTFRTFATYHLGSRVPTELIHGSRWTALVYPLDDHSQWEDE